MRDADVFGGIDGRDRLWIGTSFGAIHYRPYEEGRRWFYRAGRRYLIDDRVMMDKLRIEEPDPDEWAVTVIPWQER